MQELKCKATLFVICDGRKISVFSVHISRGINTSHEQKHSCTLQFTTFDAEAVTPPKQMCALLQTSLFASFENSLQQMSQGVPVYSSNHWEDGSRRCSEVWKAFKTQREQRVMNDQREEKSETHSRDSDKECIRTRCDRSWLLHGFSL